MKQFLEHFLVLILSLFLWQWTVIFWQTVGNQSLHLLYSCLPFFSQESELTFLKGEIARVRSDSNVEEFMALEASASIKTVQQINNQTMIDSDQMRRQLNILQDENDKLKEQLAQQVSKFLKVLCRFYK